MMTWEEILEKTDFYQQWVRSFIRVITSYGLKFHGYQRVESTSDGVHVFKFTFPRREGSDGPYYGLEPEKEAEVFQVIEGEGPELPTSTTIRYCDDFWVFIPYIIL